MPLDRSIVLLPCPVEQGYRSMDQYHRVLVQEFARASHPGFSIRSFRRPEASSRSRRKFIPLIKYGSYPLQVRFSKKPDLFHLLDHSYANLVDSISPRIKTICTAFDLCPLFCPESLSRRQLERFRSTVDRLKKVDLVVSVSHQTKKDLIEVIGVRPERIVVVPPGADWHLLQEKAIQPSPELTNRLGTRRYILSIGTINQRKNLQSLPAILAALRRNFTEPICLVRAGYSLPPALRQQMEEALGGAENLIELRHLYGDDLVAVYRRAACFILPSLWEGYSFTILEAMGAGLPVVTNRCSTNPEAGGESALYYDEGDSAAAGMLLTRLLSEPDFHAQYRAKSLERASKLTWGVHAQRLLELYREMLGK